MPGFVYLAEQDGRHKIGASRQPETRALQVAPAGRLVHFFPSGNHYKVEKALHRRFHTCRLHGEWFDLAAEDVAALCRVQRADSPGDLPDDLRRSTEPDYGAVHFDAELMRLARVVAAFHGIKAWKYIESILRPAVERDYVGAVKRMAEEVGLRVCRGDNSYPAIRRRSEQEP